MNSPVTKSDALLARNTAGPAKSSGVPQRPAGVRSSTCLSRPGKSFRACTVSGVLMYPGGIAFTRMLSGAEATARPLFSYSTAALLAAWGEFAQSRCAR